MLIICCVDYLLTQQHAEHIQKCCVYFHWSGNFVVEIVCLFWLYLVRHSNFFEDPYTCALCDENVQVVVKTYVVVSSLKL